MFMFDWAGCRGTRAYPPFGAPRHLADIWWHLPAYLVFVALYVMFRTRRDARAPIENKDDEDDGDKPITLGL